MKVRTTAHVLWGMNTRTMTLATLELLPHNRLEAILTIETSDGGFAFVRVAIGRAYASVYLEDRKAAFIKAAQTEVNIKAIAHNLAPIAVRWA